jgi:hypothetical protein
MSLPVAPVEWEGWVELAALAAGVDPEVKLAAPS